MDMFKTILITGTSRGIGFYLAEYYLSKGYSVIGTSRGESNIINKNYRHFSLDVSNEVDVKNCFKIVKNIFGTIDVLINNAGIASLNHTLLTPLNTVDKIFNTNFKGTFLFSREASKMMQKRKSGRIINFSTVAVPLNLEGEAIYASSKSAVETLTRIMSKELGSSGITINSIAPCPIETDLIKAVSKDKISKLLEAQAINRFGKFEDISNVIDFFIKDESNFVTGQTIYLGGIS
jgi:3-oxoacyl-[acyl-carrier protein] reductase